MIMLPIMPCGDGFFGLGPLVARSGLRADLEHALGLLGGLDKLVASSMVWHMGFSR